MTIKEKIIFSTEIAKIVGTFTLTVLTSIIIAIVGTFLIFEFLWSYF